MYRWNGGKVILYGAIIFLVLIKKKTEKWNKPWKMHLAESNVEQGMV